MQRWGRGRHRPVRFMRRDGVCLAAVLVLLTGCGGGAGAGHFDSPGGRVYLQNCVGCHGPTGQGMGAQPVLVGSATVNGPVPALTAWVLYGVRPTASPAGRYPALMPLFAAQPDADLAAVLTYLRSSWGHRSSAVTVADIQAARAAHAAR